MMFGPQAFLLGAFQNPSFARVLGKPRANSDLNEKSTILAVGKIKGGPPLISFEARIFLFSPEAN